MVGDTGAVVVVVAALVELTVATVVGGVGREVGGVLFGTRRAVEPIVVEAGAGAVVVVTTVVVGALVDVEIV